MAHVNIANTDTFEDWFNLTNEIATTLRSNAVVTGITAEGVFAIGIGATTELDISGSIFANSTVAQFQSNTSIPATVTTFDVAPTTVAFHPAGNTNFTTAVFVNAVMTLQKSLAGTANVSLTGRVDFTGNTTITGPTAIIGAFSVGSGVATFSGNVAAANATTTTFFVDRTNGYVGVGTPTPTYPLHTVGASYFAGNTTVTGVMLLTGASARLVIPVGTDLWAT